MSDSSETHGLLLVYTGDGKGKTTAALGLVMRALGRDQKPAVVQFIKGNWATGERKFGEADERISWDTMGRGFTWESPDISKDRRAALAAWERAQTCFSGGGFDLVVMDEFTYAINHGFVSIADTLEGLKRRSAKTHLVITGRNAHPQLCEMADLVTEMVKVKHPFDHGAKAIAGLDY